MSRRKASRLTTALRVARTFVDGVRKHPAHFVYRAPMTVALGRSLWYTLRFRRLVVVGRRSRIVVPRSAEVRIAPGGILILGLAPIGTDGGIVELHAGGVLEIRGRVQVCRGARLTVGSTGHLLIGDGTFCNEGVVIECDERIAIGANCALARRVVVMDTNSHHIFRDGQEVARTSPVTIGDRCWIGLGTTILKGVTIGPGCVVAANALVVRDLSSAQMAVGIPARSIGPVDWTL